MSRDGDDRIQRRGHGFSTSQVDKEDRWRKARDQVTTKLKRAGITTYAIGLVRELENEGLVRLTARQEAESFLTKVTKQTGGRAVISTSKKIDVDEILTDVLGP